MPNHIQNRLRVEGDADKIKELMSYIKGNDPERTNARIDFNTIINMPKELEITSGSFGELGEAILVGRTTNHFLGYEEIKRRYDAMTESQKDEALTLGAQYLINKAKHGASTWYDWCHANWGTKWNAYETPDQRDTEDTIYFQTAWSNVLNLICQLSTMFPALTLHYSYADEDSGCNVGEYTCQNGDYKGAALPNKSIEAYELFFTLHPDRRENYKFVDGKYKYDETTE